ncbi:hypothetical protein C8J57DRAFT_1255190 [Mycena rebaudengoi]|nr:hypothetical protein C8J57DRAFT_1255190 [Mycena rebaudengoi]
MTVKVHVHVKIQNKTKQYDENNVVLLLFGFRVVGSEGRGCNIASGNGTSPGACGLRGCSGAAAVYASRAAPAHDSRHVPRISAAAAPPRTAPAPAGAGATDADSDRARTVRTRGWWSSTAAPRTAAAHSHPHTRRAVVVTMCDEERREDGPGVDVPLHADDRLLLRHAVYGQRAAVEAGRRAKKPRAPRSSCSPSNGMSAPPSPHARNGGAFSYAGTSGRSPPAARFRQIGTGTAGGTGRRTRTEKTAWQDRRTKGVYEATPTPTPRARQSDSAAPRLRQHAHPPRRMTVPEPRVGALPAPTLPTAQIPPRTNETPPQFAQNEDHALQTEEQKKKRKKATDERDRCRYDEHGHRGRCRVATKEHHRDHDARAGVCGDMI